MLQSRQEKDKALKNEFNNALNINNENLLKILKDNEGTAFGKEHSFTSIKSAKEFVNKVPLSDYKTYKDIAEEPEKYTVYPINSRLATSGSTGNQKFFPLSEEALNRYSTHVLDMPNNLSNLSGNILHTNVFRSPVDGVTILSRAYFKALVSSGRYDFSEFIGGTDFTFCENVVDVNYMKAYIALSSPNVEAFQSIFLYDLAMFFSYIEKNWRTILSDVENKKFSVDLPTDIKEKLIALSPSEEWLKRAEKEFLLGFDNIVPRLWTKVKFVGGIGGKMYRFQEKALVRFIGDIPVHYSIYASSECMMGISPYLKPILSSAEYVLMPRNAYYEFIPKKGKRAIPMSKLAIGGEYEPVITTFSGLYRYKMGDILKVSGFVGQSPVFEMVGRRALVIDIAGEKIDSFTATEAVERLSVKTGITLRDFAIGIDTRIMPSGYLLFYEGENSDKKFDINLEFDNILKELSPDYKELRDLEMINKPKISPVGFGEIFNSISVAAKVSHEKPRIFINEYATDYLLERSDKNGK